MLKSILQDIAKVIKCKFKSNQVAINFGTFEEQDSLKADYNFYITFNGLTGQPNAIVNLDAPVIVASSLEYSIELLVKDIQNSFDHLDQVYSIFYSLTGYHPTCADKVKRFTVNNLIYSGKQVNNFHLYTINISATLVFSKSLPDLEEFTLFDEENVL